MPPSFPQPRLNDVTLAFLPRPCIDYFPKLPDIPARRTAGAPDIFSVFARVGPGVDGTLARQVCFPFSAKNHPEQLSQNQPRRKYY